MRTEERVSKQLIKSKKTLAIAESCTGGLLANRLTNTPGSSHFLKFSIVAYSNEAKSKLLNIQPSVISRSGAVNTQTAIAMARSARKLLNTDFGISITGIAGPGGGTKTKPVGLTFIAICTQFETLCLECQFAGTRARIKNQASTQALRLLEEFLT